VGKKKRRAYVSGKGSRERSERAIYIPRQTEKERKKKRGPLRPNHQKRGNKGRLGRKKKGEGESRFSAEKEEKSYSSFVHRGGGKAPEKKGERIGRWLDLISMSWEKKKGKMRGGGGCNFSISSRAAGKGGREKKTV